MRILLLILCCMAGNAFGQAYRLGYDGQSIPELYDRTTVFVERLENGSFQPVPNKRYRLSTNEATLKGNELGYSRAHVYRNKGIINFTLSVDNGSVPLSLQLPVLEDIRYNLYTDSIKPILNYYLNVEGKFSTGRIYPLDTTFVTITCDAGTMRGLEWILPKERNFEKVTFTTTSKFDPGVSKTVTLYLKKAVDPRDDPKYEDRTEDDVIHNRRKKSN